MIKILEKEISALDKIVGSEPGLQSRSKLIQSIQGVGKITAWTLLAYLIEIEHLNRNRLVALSGIAPFNRGSGKFSGKRSIIGGRAKVRRCLYMTTQSAANCNPIISAYVQRLRERGKPYKCAIVAAMRKLILHIQSLIKKPKFSTC